MIEFRVEVHPLPEQAEIKLIAINVANEDIAAEFSTSQFFDFIIIGPEGEEVYHYAEGRFFLQAFQSIKIRKGSRKSWKCRWDYRKNGRRVKGGMYDIHARLLPYSINGRRIEQHISGRARFAVPEE